LAKNFCCGTGNGYYQANLPVLHQYVANCWGSEAVQSATYAVASGTLAVTSGSHAEISATVPPRQPQHPALSATGLTKKTDTLIQGKTYSENLPTHQFTLLRNQKKSQYIDEFTMIT
jgi:hypothetical protein